MNQEEIENMNRQITSNDIESVMTVLFFFIASNAFLNLKSVFNKTFDSFTKCF